MNKSMTHVLQTAVIAAGTLALVNCKVGPNYETPTVRVAEKYAATAPASAPATMPATAPATTNPEVANITTWWETFQDPTLNDLIQQAVKANLDIQLATSRVRQARAELAYYHGALFPTLNASGSGTRTRNSHNDGSMPGTRNNFRAGFDAGWEIDVFGGTRRAVESAEYGVQTQVESQRDTLVTLLSEVASNYMMVRGYQHERQIILENIQSQSDVLALQKRRLTAGVANDLPVAQTEALLASTRANLPNVEAAIQRAIHRIAVLLDQDTAAVAATLEPQAPLPAGPQDLPVGLPSELLRRRPDIRQAERNLAVATANIGVATADLYPRFNLVGSIGTSTAKLKYIADAESLVWSIGPSVSWNIFNAGQTRANIEIRKAMQEQALIAYRKTIIQAVSEVEDSIENYRQNMARREALLSATEANRRSLELAKRQNAAGVVDFLNVLNAQQSLYTSEDALAQSEQNVATSLVALYKALGGGWESFEEVPKYIKRQD